MRTATDQRICDRCKKALHEDSGVWRGGYIATVRTPVSGDGPETISYYDLCIECAQQFGEWMKSAP